MTRAAVNATGASQTGPVTLIFERRVKPGRHEDYKRLLAALQQDSRGVPGYQGASVVRSPNGREYVSIVRFDSLESLRAWQSAGSHESWEQKLTGIVEGAAHVRTVSGMEFWFTAPGVTAPLPPSPHKMALVLFLVVCPLSAALGPPLTWFTPGAPAPVRISVMAAVQVSLLTYLIMPRVTRLLASWLYPTGKATEEE